MMRTRTIELNNGAKFLAFITLLILSISLSACGGGGGGGGGGGITPAAVTVSTGASFPFTTGANQDVVWKVNGTAGGTAAVGTIDPTGVYTAPAVAPAAPGTVTVTVVSKTGQAILGTATVTVVPFAGYAGTFLNVSSMKNARSNHTATLLPTTVSTAVPTGYTLVAGGIGSSGAAIDKAELFNPAFRAFGHFSSVGSMTVPRAHHAAARLYDGRVLITGGIDSNNSPLASAEIYNPSSKTFTATGSMASARCMHTATLLSNGKVLIAGGNGNATFDGGIALGGAELYDPATGQFTVINVLNVVQSLVHPRYYHTATLQNDGRVLLAGGQGLGGAKLADVELFDPATNTFAPTGRDPVSGNYVGMVVDPSVDTGRWLHTATLLSDGTSLMVGGDPGNVVGTYLNSGQYYTLASGVFTDLLRFLDPPTNTIVDPASQLTYARGLHTAVRLASGGTTPFDMVMFAGGIGDTGVVGAQSDFLSSAEVYNVSTKVFSTTNSMHAARANHTATSLSNGGVVVIGGNNSGLFLKSAELYQ